MSVGTALCIVAGVLLVLLGFNIIHNGSFNLVLVAAGLTIMGVALSGVPIVSTFTWFGKPAAK